MGYARIRWDTLGYARIRLDMLGYTEKRWDTLGYARIRQDTPAARRPPATTSNLLVFFMSLFDIVPLLRML